MITQTVCYKHPQQFTEQFPGSTLTCCTCWEGGKKKNLCADGFYFPYWHYCFAHFQFSCHGAKTCLQFIWSSKHWCLCLKYQTGLLHICSPSFHLHTPLHWWENGLLLLYARVELIFMTTNSPQLNVRNDWVFFYLSQIRAIKWIIA